MIHRGEIYFIERYGDEVGSEQRSGRPAIIVSNDTFNATSPIVEIVYMTTEPKKDLPTHVLIRSAPKVSTALCEQITSVSITRLQTRVGTCTADEMARIDSALCVSLGMDIGNTVKTAVRPLTPPETHSEGEAIRMALAEEKAWKNAYKRLYEELVEKCAERGMTP